MSKELIKRADELLENEVKCRHSYFQMKHFIVGQQPTHQSRMWQCLQEIKSRRDSVTAIKMEIDDANDKLELLDIQEEKLLLKAGEKAVAHTDEEERTASLNYRENEIGIRRLRRKKAAALESLAHLKEKQKNNLEEMAFFVQTFEGLEKKSPLKPFDDLESQKEYWNARLTEEINLRMLLQQPLDTELIKTILAIHNDAPIKKQTLAMLDHQQALLTAKGGE